MLALMSLTRNIVEQGNRKQLLKNGAYAALYYTRFA